MGISTLSFAEKSLLFAKLSSIAYNNIKDVKKQVKKLGFTTVEFYESNGAQAYRFMNKTDLVIACRGTQPTEFNDISADLKAIPVIAETISRVHQGFKELNDPVELYTFGSPRVGWRGYCKSLGVVHHRWKNNNDIVTTVPLALMGYVHHGEQHYLNAYGNYRKPTGWQLLKDKLRGMWMGIKQGKIDNFSDHSMVEYIKHISKLD